MLRLSLASETTSETYPDGRRRLRTTRVLLRIFLPRLPVMLLLLYTASHPTTNSRQTFTSLKIHLSPPPLALTGDCDPHRVITTGMIR